MSTGQQIWSCLGNISTSWSALTWWQVRPTLLAARQRLEGFFALWILSLSICPYRCMIFKPRMDRSSYLVKLTSVHCSWSSLQKQWPLHIYIRLEEGFLLIEVFFTIYHYHTLVDVKHEMPKYGDIFWPNYSIFFAGIYIYVPALIRYGVLSEVKAQGNQE